MDIVITDLGLDTETVIWIYGILFILMAISVKIR